MPHTIIIHPVLNGFTVQVGCQIIVITSPVLLGNEITRYYLDPEKVELEYRKNAINKMESVPMPAEPCNTVAPQTDVAYPAAACAVEQRR